MQALGQDDTIFKDNMPTTLSMYTKISCTLEILGPLQ